MKQHFAQTSANVFAMRQERFHDSRRSQLFLCGAFHHLGVYTQIVAIRETTWSRRSIRSEWPKRKQLRLKEEETDEADQRDQEHSCHQQHASRKREKIKYRHNDQLDHHRTHAHFADPPLTWQKLARPRSKSDRGEEEQPNEIKSTWR